MTPNNRIWFLQLSRAIACLVVVSGHWVAYIINPNGILELFNLPYFSTYPDAPLLNLIHSSLSGLLPANFREAYFGVGLFFLISGYVIPYSMKKSHLLNFYLEERCVFILQFYFVSQ